ncbi:unnamed protein product [Microthlaspi erraticum]|uniref:RNase H type-1 domain-containing protein n=1 Tax=Microthlaspi erraticum TaxID=1685480 RepID=A0A6D2I8J7_9BRAS|nr:unnamed protein product [Microthlaspi erraticum]
MEEWRNQKEVKEKGSATNLNAAKRAQWTPPPEGWVKCNVDGTWSQTNAHCGISWVLRDEQGRVLWIGARKLPKVHSVLEVKLEALRWAILRVTGLSYDKVIFETDSQISIDRGRIYSQGRCGTCPILI